MKINFNILKNICPKSGNLDVQIDKNSAIYNKIEKILPELQNSEIKLNHPLKFAPKGANATLMNYGPYTTVLKNNDLQTKIAEQVYDHLYKVRTLEKNVH